MTTTLDTPATLDALDEMEGALVCVQLWPLPDSGHEVDRPAAKLAGVLRRRLGRSSPAATFEVLPAHHEGGKSPFQFSVSALAASEWGVGGHRAFDCPPNRALIVATAGTCICVQELAGSEDEG
jgi:hypothetical protein